MSKSYSQITSFPNITAFSGSSYGDWDNTNFGLNSGSAVTCTAGNYVAYASASKSTLVSEVITVPSGYGLTLTFLARKYGSFLGTPYVAFKLGKRPSTPPYDYYSSPANYGWQKLGNFSALTTSCATQTFSLPASLVGGQDLVLAIYCATTSSATNGYSIDNITISTSGYTALPVVNGSTSWTEDFSSATWYNSSFSALPGSYVKTGFRTKYNATGSDVYLYYTSSGGANGTTVNYLGTSSNYYCQFNSASDPSFGSAAQYSGFVTWEINTSGCANPTLRFAFKNETGLGAGTNYSYTSDEKYRFCSPKVYYTTTDGYNGLWTQIPINYYFPMGVWWYASYAVPSVSKIKFRFEVGSTTSYSQRIDDIKILCNDCRISNLAGGAISGPGGWMPNTEYTFTIDPTTTAPYATYYKWIVRNKTTTPATIYYGTTPTVNPTNPVIVTGQGTTSATINFGTAVVNPASTFRVMCIPYDANPGTDASPDVDVCYASISVFSPPPLPVELLNFEASYINESILLSWSTATETSNDYFTIEKSINAEDWVPVGTVDGAGSSNELINYEFEDAEPMSGTSYYRLKQTDFDGKYEYFGPVTVNCNEGANGIIAYPNPAQENVLVVGSQDVAADIYLCDLTGRIISAYSCSRLSEPFSVDLQNIMPGIYLIRVDSQNSSEYFRVVKE